MFAPTQQTRWRAHRERASAKQQRAGQHGRESLPACAARFSALFALQHTAHSEHRFGQPAMNTPELCSLVLPPLVLVGIH
jgi:hypothetical protein